MTRRTFGGIPGDSDWQPPPPPRHPREDLKDRVAIALEEHYSADELDRLADMIRHYVTGDPDGVANQFHDQVTAAAAAARVPDVPATAPLPAGDPVPFSVYATAEGGDPLPILLGPTGAEERVTVVPAGRSDWRLADDAPEVARIYPGAP